MPSKKPPKLQCLRSNVTSLAEHHNVLKLKMPVDLFTLRQLGGRWAMADEYALDVRRLFCHVDTKGTELHLEAWHWPKQIHHSTLVIYDDDTYEVISYTREGRGHTTLWNYFLKCARIGYFFKMPKEAEI